MSRSLMSSRQHPWPSTQWLLVAPRCWLGMFGSHAISVAGESVLNSLPDSLLDLALSKDDFRHLLKTHLITLYWSIWRIRGVTWWYTVQMDNFLTWSLIRRVICRKFRNRVVQIPKFDANHNPSRNPMPICYGQMTLRTSELSPLTYK